MAPRVPSKAAAAAISIEQATVALVWGNDEYRVSQKAKEWSAIWCPPAQQDLGLEIIDGAVETIGEAVSAVERTLDALSTVGLFGGAKVVWLRDASFFSESPPGKYEAVKAVVARLTEEIKRGLLPGQRLLVSASKVHRGYAFYKACQAAGLVADFDQPEKVGAQREQAEVTVRELLREARIKVNDAVVDALVEKAGYATRQLIQEVNKLDLYLGDRRELTLDDVRDMASVSRQSATWDLAEALCKRDLGACLRLFRQLVFQKEHPVVLMMGVEGRIRDMLVARELMDRGYLSVSDGSRFVQATWSDRPEARATAEVMAGAMLKWHPYRLSMLALAARAFTADELRRWYQVAARTHARMTDGGAPQEVLMECAIIEMLKGSSCVAM